MNGNRSRYRRWLDSHRYLIIYLRFRETPSKKSLAPNLHIHTCDFSKFSRSISRLVFLGCNTLGRDNEAIVNLYHNNIYWFFRHKETKIFTLQQTPTDYQIWHYTKEYRLCTTHTIGTVYYYNRHRKVHYHSILLWHYYSSLFSDITTVYCIILWHYLQRIPTSTKDCKPNLYSSLQTAITYHIYLNLLCRNNLWQQP